MAPTLDPDPGEHLTRRERLAGVIERRLDIPMAALAVVWAGLVAYELIAPFGQRDELTVIGNVIWGVFVVEFVVKLVVSGHPLRFLRQRWPSLLFLILPALRLFRVIRAVRVLRALPAARVVGSSYRAIGTARSLLGGRIAFLSVTTAVVVFSGGQLLFLTEGRPSGREASLGDTLWWSANNAISGSLVYQPESAAGRIVSLLLSAYAVVVFASVAATLGAYFIESRVERAEQEEEEAAAAAGVAGPERGPLPRPGAG